MIERAKLWVGIVVAGVCLAAVGLYPAAFGQGAPQGVNPNASLTVAGLVNTSTSDLQGLISNSTGTVAVADAQGITVTLVASGSPGITIPSGARLLLDGSTTRYLQWNPTNGVFEFNGIIKTAAGALPTCNATKEGATQLDNTGGGTGTTKNSKPCVCISDGAASPAYKWRNMLNQADTSGTTTVCPDSL